tara:strand:+ start:755 stop:1972 length:1218 start_codon:yes stop_codon:yes gene_type:complete
MAVKIPSQSEIEQFMDDIDNLEGYSFYEWLDYMEENYPNVDAIELYTSKGKNIVTGYYDEGGGFIQGEEPEPIEEESILDVVNATRISEGLPTIDYDDIPQGWQLDVENGGIDGLSKVMETDDEEAARVMAEDTPINSGDPMQLGEGIGDLAEAAGLPEWAGMLIAAGVTRDPKKLVKPKSNILKEKDGMLSTKNSTILKETTPKIGAVIPKAKVPLSKSTVSTKNSRVLKETTPKVNTKNSTILKDKNVDAITKKANVAKVDAITKSRKLTTKDKALAAGITTAAGIAALTNQNGLTGERDSDGSLMMAQGPTSRGSKGTHTMPDGTEMKDSDMMDDMPPYEKSIDDRDIASKSTGKPGWTLDGKGGNYLSANFEDDYWNTPDGVEEAIGIWGRPVGNKIGNKY